jgi:hypothetical protein
VLVVSLYLYLFRRNSLSASETYSLYSTVAEVEGVLCASYSTVLRAVSVLQPLFGTPFVDTDHLAESFTSVTDASSAASALLEVITALGTISDEVEALADVSVFEAVHSQGCTRATLGLGAFCPPIEPYAEDALMSFTEQLADLHTRVLPHLAALVQDAIDAGLPLAADSEIKLAALPDVAFEPFYDDDAGYASEPIITLTPDIPSDNITYFVSIFPDLLSGAHEVSQLLTPAYLTAHSAIYLRAFIDLVLFRALMALFVHKRELKEAINLAYAVIGSDQLRDLADRVSSAVKKLDADNETDDDAQSETSASEEFHVQ